MCCLNAVSLGTSFCQERGPEITYTFDLENQNQLDKEIFL
jgi:hypothetical protein